MLCEYEYRVLVTLYQRRRKHEYETAGRSTWMQVPVWGNEMEMAKSQLHRNQSMIAGGLRTAPGIAAEGASSATVLVPTNGTFLPVGSFNLDSANGRHADQEPRCHEVQSSPERPYCLEPVRFGPRGANNVAAVESRSLNSSGYPGTFHVRTNM